MFKAGDRVQWEIPNGIAEGTILGRWDGTPFGDKQWTWETAFDGWVVKQDGDTVPEMVPDGAWIEEVNK